MENFDDIRPFKDSEYESVIKQLLSEDEFIFLLKNIYGEKYKYCIAALEKVKSHDEFIKAFVKPLLEIFINKTIAELKYSGIEKINTAEPCVFISNHRDIVMDPSLISYGTYTNNLPIAESAIGNNLLIRPWIEIFVKLNKAFVVKRNISGRELLLSSIHLSNYIKYSILEKKSFVWIAQREGRAKDGNDQTQSSLIRMLAMSNKDLNIVDAIQKLNISPISISYEFDPCDGLKAKELFLKSKDNNFQKSQEDDLKSMETGITGFKGNVVVCYSNSINDDLEKIKSNKEFCNQETIAKIINNKIFKNYHLFDTHKVAYNLTTQTNTFKVEPEKELEIKKYFLNQLLSVGLSENELPFILMQYANPVKNQISAEKL